MNQPYDHEKDGVFDDHGCTAGILFPAEPNEDASRLWIMACDECDRFRSQSEGFFSADRLAAMTISNALNLPMGQECPAGTITPHPYIDADESELLRKGVLARTGRANGRLELSAISRGKIRALMAAGMQNN